ncbi:MAG: transposase [Gammaproteobacteria bacterium]|nr:transposase [Gammaproteobacteria bacterium]
MISSCSIGPTPGYFRFLKITCSGEFHSKCRVAQFSWAAISSVAVKIGCTPETLRSWVKKIEPDSGAPSGEVTDPAKRVKELERDNRELKRASGILPKAAAFFAQSALDWATAPALRYYRPSLDIRNPGDGGHYRSVTESILCRADLQGITDCTVHLLSP